jgi:hypothetical protein
VVTFIAGLVAFHDLQNLFACVSGLTLLVSLFAYDRRGARTGWQSLAFAFVAGLALLLAILYPLRLLLAGFTVTNELPALVWLVGTAAFWFIDRARMDARHAASFAGYSQPPLPQAAPSIYPVSSYAAPPPAPAPAPVQRTFTPAPQPPPPPLQRTFAQPPPEPEPQPVAQPAPAPELEPMINAVPPARAPIPRGQGKEVSIYINLLGEGMNVLRAVRAEHLGRDYYIITEEMPEGESWEYAPGQVVRCRKKNLSSGKGLVAYEEAPRAQ